MSRTKHEAVRQEVFFGDLEFSKMALGWKIMLEEMPCQWSGEILHSLFSAANLNCINSILFLSLYLSDLTSIDLDDCAGNMNTPFIPVVSHAHLVSK